MRDGKKIVITTVQKFPFILDEIGNEHRDGKFAIIIDEAHSSQGGRTAAKMNIALSENGAEDEEETTEDKINRIMESRKMLPNASYFAFTATPKNKTLEIFGEPFPVGDEDEASPVPQLHDEAGDPGRLYSGCAEELHAGQSYYRLMKTIEDDPEFDTKKAKKKLRHYVEATSTPSGEKAEIMVDHFHEQVIAQQKIGGQARAMVVTGGIQRAIQYFHAFRDYLAEIKSPYKAIVAFSGEHEYGGAKVTEASLNGFPSNKIADKIRGGPLPVSDRGGEVPDRLRRAAAAHDVCGQDCSRESRPCRRFPG